MAYLREKIFKNLNLSFRSWHFSVTISPALLILRDLVTIDPKDICNGCIVINTEFQVTQKHAHVS